MTATVGIRLPCSSESVRIVSTRLRKVASAMRPGIQPSQYSTARRADAGVFPQYQKGTGPPSGFGSMVTLSKS